MPLPRKREYILAKRSTREQNHKENRTLNHKLTSSFLRNRFQNRKDQEQPFRLQLLLRQLVLARGINLIYLSLPPLYLLTSRFARATQSLFYENSSVCSAIPLLDICPFTFCLLANCAFYPYLISRKGSHFLWKKANILRTFIFSFFCSPLLALAAFATTTVRVTVKAMAAIHVHSTG